MYLLCGKLNPSGSSDRSPVVLLLESAELTGCAIQASAHTIGRGKYMVGASRVMHGYMRSRCRDRASRERDKTEDSFERQR